MKLSHSRSARRSAVSGCALTPLGWYDQGTGGTNLTRYVAGSPKFTVFKAPTTN